MKKKLPKGKWNKCSDVMPPDDEEVHIWGKRAGLHTGWWTGNEWRSWTHDPYDATLITHWFAFPDEPRKHRR